MPFKSRSGLKPVPRYETYRPTRSVITDEVSLCRGARCKSVVKAFAHGVMDRSFMGWTHFSFQPVLHDSCNKGRGMCNPVCGMVHIKEPLLLIGKSSPCGSSGFPLPLSGPLPYVRRHVTVNKMC